MKRPVAFLAISFLFGTTFYVASHVIAESRANAASLAALAQQVPTLQVPATQVQPPDQQRPAQVAQPEPAKTPQKRVDENAKPELMSRHIEQQTEQAHEREKRKELCRKLEQRRQELRHEQEVQAREHQAAAAK